MFDSSWSVVTLLGFRTLCHGHAVTLHFLAWRISHLTQWYWIQQIRRLYFFSFVWAGIWSIFENASAYKLPMRHMFHVDVNLVQCNVTTYGWTWPTKCGWLVWTLQSAWTWVPMYVVRYSKIAWCLSWKGPKHHGWDLCVVWNHNLATLTLL